MYFCLLALKQNCANIYVKETFFCENGFQSSRFWRKCIFFRIFKQKLFFCKKTILKIKATAFRVQKTFFFFLKGKKDRASVFCASKQVKSLESDRKCVFCRYRNWNKQFSRKNALFGAWIRRKCCVKPLANEFMGLCTSILVFLRFHAVIFI